MSFYSKRELLATVVPRYREGNKKLKSTILNEFISSRKMVPWSASSKGIAGQFTRTKGLS